MATDIKKVRDRKKQKDALLAGIREKATRWLADGTTIIGVFENKDLGSRDVGMRIAMPFELEGEEGFEIGKTKAPDTSAYGPGWRYLLVVKCRSVDELLRAFDPEGAR